jgi:hypothetical protein
MALPPGASGSGSAELIEPPLAFFDPRRFDAIQERPDLALQPQQLRAGLTEAAVVVGQFSHGGELLGREGDVLGSALTAVAQHGAGMEFSLGAAAGGLPAAAAERVEGAGQERLAGEEGFQQGQELLLEFPELPTEGAEVVRHG